MVEKIKPIVNFLKGLLIRADNDFDRDMYADYIKTLNEAAEIIEKREEKDG